MANRAFMRKFLLGWAHSPLWTLREKTHPWDYYGSLFCITPLLSLPSKLKIKPCFIPLPPLLSYITTTPLPSSSKKWNLKYSEILDRSHPLSHMWKCETRKWMGSPSFLPFSCAIGNLHLRKHPSSLASYTVFSPHGTFIHADIRTEPPFSFATNNQHHPMLSNG